jgi:hypothetical protein
MRVPILLLAAVATSCQRPAENLDVDVDVVKLTPTSTADTTPVSVTRPTFEARVLPPLSARATLTPLPISIELHVVVVGATGGELAIEYVTPDGSMYQRQVQPLVEAPFAEQAFDFSLPVAGTWIEANQLYGDWNAHVLVGAAELLSEPFTLSP